MLSVITGLLATFSLANNLKSAKQITAQNTLAQTQDQADDILVQPEDLIAELISDIIKGQDQGQDPNAKPKITILIPTPIGTIEIIWENNGNYLSDISGLNPSADP